MSGWIGLWVALLSAAAGAQSRGIRSTAVLSDNLQIESKPIEQTLHGGGEWSDSAQRTVSDQSWNVNAVRMSDRSLSGRVAVSGSSVIREANLEGTLSGRGVFGRLLDDEGEPLAEFQGAVTKAGASGTYRDKLGNSGTWRWQGEIKPVEAAPAAP